MSDVIDEVLPLLQNGATAAQWEAALADDVFFETLGLTLSGRAEVAAKLAEQPFSALTWARSDLPSVDLTGTRSPGTRDREFFLLIKSDQGKITRFSQQNAPALPHPEVPLRMDDEMRAVFDGGYAARNPFTLSYVDEQGRPHLSPRGSVITFGEDRLAMWARSATSGMATALAVNPNVALLFRDGTTHANYQLRGRGHVATDDATRQAVFDKLPLFEQQHDFAMLGAAIVIDLDLIEGWAGFGPQGMIGGTRMVRAAD